MSTRKSTYTQIIKNFFSDLAELPPNSFSKIIESLERSTDYELAVIYTRLILSSISYWLQWEDECRENSTRGVCKEIIDIVKERGAGLGIVSFFNTELKTLLVKMYRDFSPGIVIPRWIVFYSGRVNRGILDYLRTLPVEEQVSRIPVFIALLYLLESTCKAIVDHYASKKSEYAYTSASYIYWEIIKPATLFSEAFLHSYPTYTKTFNNIGSEIYSSVRRSLRESSSLFRVNYALYMGRLVSLAKNTVIGILRNERMRKSRI